MIRLKAIASLFVSLTLLGSVLPRTGAALEGGVGEYQVKAAMLYNVAKFVDWPNEIPDSDQAPFMVCIIGRNPFGAALDLLKGKPVKGRKLMFSQLSRTEEVGSCQVLFISSSERRNLAAILGEANRRAVLTVSDSDRFAANGGMIGFVEADGKIRLEVNLEAAQKANLRVSSQLLKLARIVRGGE